MNAQPTAVRLELISAEAATMSFNGPFGCVPEALQTAACALNGWSRAMVCSNEHEEIDVTIEFDYGDYVYRENHTLFDCSAGGVQATLFWLDADICDWMANELPKQMAARRMVEQWFGEGEVS